MIVLLAFAFVAGLVTILSPCILPILPVVLSGALSGGRWRPLGVVTGFILSFTFFAVFSFTLAKALGVSSEVLRHVAVVLLIVFGVSMFVPRVQLWLESFASRFSSGAAGQRRVGFGGGVVLGISLGFIWTPCVGPILASVLTLAATSQITFELVLITLAFSMGTAIPMLAIGYGGQRVLTMLPALRSRSEMIQKVFGVLIIVTAFLIFFNIDRKFQTYVLDVFPTYGEGLTGFENTDFILDRLDELQGGEDMPLLPDSVRENGDGEPAPNPTFEGATNWINSEPLSLNDELKGKVVLVDFWTYTCINCIRTFPYVTAWYDRYKDDGLVILGVHTPEFEFEKNTQNVTDAMAEYGIEYPVVQDNDYRIWRSYNNRFWPAHYLIDRHGKVRYTHFGEGKYEETEHMIRKLLAEEGSVTADMSDIEDKTPLHNRTPETYLGYARMERFASPESVSQGVAKVYSVPVGLAKHSFAYGGEWTIQPEYSLSTKGSEIVIRYEAAKVFLVMKPTGETPVTVRVVKEGSEKGAETGFAVDSKEIVVDRDALYELVVTEDVHQGILKLIFDGAVEVYAFTFG